MTQGSFLTAFMDPGLGRNARLEAIGALIDWAAIEPLVASVRAAETGRPPYPPLAMLKALYLAALYDLSDVQLEEALSDRLSFRTFVGLALDQATPDSTTICRFRSAAIEAGVIERAFAAVTTQIEDKGLVLKKGTLLDATLVAARTNKPSPQAGKAAVRSDEPGAAWTTDSTKRRSFFGYKLHAGVDEGSLIVRRLVFTPANIYESLAADALIVGDERAVYADKAYELGERRTRLKARAVKDRIMHRASKHNPVLASWKQKRNALIARRRAPVEGVFSLLKRVHGLARARLKNLARNAGDAFLAVTAYNLKRAAGLALR
jgi:IS5 family transposase